MGMVENDPRGKGCKKSMHSTPVSLCGHTLLSAKSSLPYIPTGLIILLIALTEKAWAREMGTKQ